METTKIFSDPRRAFTIAVREDGGDDVLRADVSLEPRSPGPPLHMHPTLEERFEGVSGAVVVQIGKERRSLLPGEQAVAPPTVAHRFWNGTDEPASFVGEIRPASPAFLEFLSVIAALAHDGRTKRNGEPRFLQGAVLLDEYLDVIALPGIPLGLQRVVFGLLAPVGRLLGHRAHLPAVPDGSAG
jgi:mannose-6-phosphate isomerase-like protein (cupin superfamily)